MKPLSAAVAQPNLDRWRCDSVGEEVVKEGGYFGHVVRIDELEGGCPNQFLGRVAQHTMDRRALVADHSVVVNHRDHISCILNERAKSILAASLVQALGQRHTLKSEGDLRIKGVDCATHFVGERRVVGQQHECQELILRVEWHNEKDASFRVASEGTP